MEQITTSSIAGSESRSTVSAGTQTLSNEGANLASTNPSSYTGTPYTAEAKSIDTTKKSQTLKKSKKSKRAKEPLSDESSDSSHCDDSTSEDSSSIEDSSNTDTTDSSPSESESLVEKAHKPRAKKVNGENAKIRKSRSKVADVSKQVKSDDKSCRHCDNEMKALKSDGSSKLLSSQPTEEENTESGLMKKAHTKSECKSRIKSKSKGNLSVKPDDSSNESSDEDELEIKSQRTKRPAKTQKKINTTGKCTCERLGQHSDQAGADTGFDQKSASRFQWKSLHHRGVQLSKKVVERARELRDLKGGPAEPKSEESTSVKTSSKAGSRMEFVRLDHRWENHTWVTRPTGEDAEAEDYDDFAFKVKRELDSDGKYQQSSVEIANKALQKALLKVLGKVKCVSLVGDRPSLDPDVLFMFHAELTAYRKDLKTRIKSAKKRSQVKRMRAQIKVLKLLFEYIDKDYSEHRKKLGPMLKSGSIRFPLLWALFKPNAVIYAPTYQNDQVPRAFRVEYIFKVGALPTETY